MEAVCSPVSFSPLLIGKLAGAAFFAILFLQSGMDKLNDWQGNKSWITGYFAKTPFRNMAVFLLGLLACLELSAGLFSAVGIITTFTCYSSTYLVFGAMLSALSLLSLFLGMRIAKDYAAAASIAGYFAVCLGWIILLAV